ncbi:hypothetical protein HZH68_012317 [Vespula germanica]|uniref:Uncharacterized protein n=1 Tax=Vespula germanica TaxID=30212 RepID=A0A834JHY3_VESGE|nr:hypothetical protein HZH68_012317 [Vespula germanica]
MDGWMDGWTDSWTDGWMDGWMDGWIGRTTVGGNFNKVRDSLVPFQRDIERIYKRLDFVGGKNGRKEESEVWKENENFR